MTIVCFVLVLSLQLEYKNIDKRISTYMCVLYLHMFVAIRSTCNSIDQSLIFSLPKNLCRTNVYVRVKYFQYSRQDVKVKNYFVIYRYSTHLFYVQ